MKRPLLIRKMKVSRHASTRYYLGVILGAAHSFQFQTLKSFSTLRDAELALKRANTDEAYKLELYGWKGVAK
jgi:hypothetical protein